MRSYIIFFIFSLIVSVSNAGKCTVNSKDQYGTAYNIIVARDGSGQHTNVQDAVNQIPDKNTQWIGIYVKPGTYVGQVNIPKLKECIILVGRSAQETIITFDRHDAPLLQETATFAVAADNFIAKGITFKNTYRNSQAIAFLATGDRQAFYKCGFVGYQDTINDQSGRHYFTSCYVEGVVDFIFGGGQSIYEECQINAVGSGYITAQNRGSPNNPGGYVFHKCHISGRRNQVTNLGRAYGPYSRVIYLNSRFDDNIITPQGWDLWNQHGHEKDVTYAEVNCKTDTSHRKLETQISPAQINQFTVQNFINRDGWIGRLPCFYCQFPSVLK